MFRYMACITAAPPSPLTSAFVELLHRYVLPHLLLPKTIFFSHENKGLHYLFCVLDLSTKLLSFHGDLI